MARYITLDWDHHQLHLVVGNVGGRGAAQATQSVVLNEEREPFLGNPEELGERLKSRMREAGIKNAPVLACIGRDRLILKEIKFPDVPKENEASIIRFQINKELTESTGDVLIDYVVLPRGAQGNRALGIVVRRDLIETYQAMCRHAGLRLAGVTPRPLALASCLHNVIASSPLSVTQGAEEVAALVTISERWAEMIITRGEQVLMNRTLTIGPGLAGEIKRNLALHVAHAPTQPVGALYLALGGEYPDLRGKLENLLDIPVRPFDPFAGAEGPQLAEKSRGSFAGAVGLLHLQANHPKELPINFLKPKESKETGKPQMRVAMLVGLLLLTLFTVGIIIARRDINRRREQAEALADRVMQLENQKRAIEKQAKEIEMLADWDNVVWLDELYDLAHRIPQISDNFRLLKIEGLTTNKQTSRRRRTRGKTEKSKLVAMIKLEGYAPDNKPIDQLLRGFQDDNEKSEKPDIGFYQPSTPTVTQRRFSRIKRFTMAIGIRKRPREAYTRSFRKERDPLEGFDLDDF